MNENQRKAAQHNWMRRCLMGSRASLERVRTSDTATDEARQLASEIDDKIRELVRLLEKRKDQV